MKGRPNLTLLRAAVAARDVLSEHGGFVADTKRQFACRMDWYDTHDAPDVRRVQDVCTLTRDQSQWPEAEEMLVGCIIAYSPVQGGMQLFDPTSPDPPPDAYLRHLYGDMLRQNQHEVENRRRLPIWETATDASFKSGDIELARQLDEGLVELRKGGVIPQQLLGRLIKAVASRLPS